MLYIISKLKENTAKRTIAIIKGGVSQWDIIEEIKE